MFIQELAQLLLRLVLPDLRPALGEEASEVGRLLWRVRRKGLAASPERFGSALAVGAENVKLPLGLLHQIAG